MVGVHPALFKPKKTTEDTEDTEVEPGRARVRTDF